MLKFEKLFDTSLVDELLSAYESLHFREFTIDLERFRFTLRKQVTQIIF